MCETEAVTLAQSARLTEVLLSTLRVDTIARFDLYMQTQPGEPVILYRHKDLPVTEEVRLRLAQHNKTRIFIDSSQEKEYQRYLEENLPAILDDPALAMPEKTQILYFSAQGLVKGILSEPRSRALAERSKEYVTTTVRFICEQRTAFQHLLRVISRDYYTFTHSVDVFVFSIVLARRTGTSDPAALREFGAGLLLHDVGKALIDPAIINCKGKLNEKQWAIMKLHPVYGYDLLNEHGTFSALSLDVVRHHHERLEGGGYPDNLSGDQISPFVRVSTIADIFSALTTHRPYKDALDSYHALKLMRDEMSDQLDPQLLHTFIGMMGNPAG